jgi:hypothetical protein
MQLRIAYLLDIDARSTFENLGAPLMHVESRFIVDSYLDDSLVAYSVVFVSFVDETWIRMQYEPRASRTCPDLSVPSARVSVTISL